jgi:hypothetical protein
MTRSQCSKIGQISAMIETMKMQSNNEGGGNTFGRAEQAVGNPLQRAIGPQEEAWSTTQNLSNQNLETLYNGIPLFLLAGNRPDGQFPPSALEGGRLKPLLCAVHDDHGKFKVFLFRRTKFLCSSVQKNKFLVEKDSNLFSRTLSDELSF